MAKIKDAIEDKKLEELTVLDMEHTFEEMKYPWEKKSNVYDGRHGQSGEWDEDNEL